MFPFDISPFRGPLNSISWPRDENESALKPTSRPPQSVRIADLTCSLADRLGARVRATLRLRHPAGNQATDQDVDKVMIADCAKLPTAARGDQRRGYTEISLWTGIAILDVVYARTQRDERKSRSSRGAERSNDGWPVKQIFRNQGPQCLDQFQVQPALMLRQLAFAMRISRALYAGCTARRSRSTCQWTDDR